MMQHTTDSSRHKPGTLQGLGARLTARLNLRVMAIVAAVTLAGVMTFAWGTTRTNAAVGTAYVNGVTFPFNGVWLDSNDAATGHFWDSVGTGFCRIDADPASATGFSVNAATCDRFSKKATQSVVGPLNPAGSPDAGKYYVYQADMAANNSGPVRITYDPTGSGSIVPNSGVLIGGLNTVGFFSNAGGSFKSSAVALGPCKAGAVPGAVLPAGTACKALYVAFERSQMIERISFVDQDPNAQTIETISKVTDPRKGVRFGIGMFHKADGTDDLYIAELGGNGVSVISNVATCSASETPGAAGGPPVLNAAGGCVATVEGRITTNFPQGFAVQNDASGNGQFIYTADSPRNASASVLRFSPLTGLQDVVSSSLAAGVCNLANPLVGGLCNPITTYTFIMGLAVNPHNGDLFIGDDPAFAILVNPPLNTGHIFKIAGVGGIAPADCIGGAVACTPPPAPSTVIPALYSYGLTAPKGGTVFVPAVDGGHIWAGDHSQGFCRMDDVVTVPALHAYNPAACDDGLVLGSAGQAVYDPTNLAAVAASADCPALPVTPAVDGVFDLLPNCGSSQGGVAQFLHYIYVAQNDRLSPGLIRFTYDPTADGGRGMLVANSAIPMAQAAGIDGDKANGVALGPCLPAGAVCTTTSAAKRAVYVGGLVDGFIRRIVDPLADPRFQTVQVVAQTTNQRAGVLGRGINGSIGMIGDDLYLPENQGFTVVRNISTCGGANAVCDTSQLPIAQFGFIFGAAIGTDPDLTHSTAGLVYASISAGVANATVYQYDVAQGTARVYATQGQMPAAGTAAATVWCTTTCTRPLDPADPPGALANFRFAQGLMVDAGGNVYITEDAFAGARGGRGHAWLAQFNAYPCPPAGCGVAAAVPPVVTSFSATATLPLVTTTGAPGTAVTITGANFTGATSVAFNGVAQPTFTVVNATTITTTVPAAAVPGTAGPISVTSPAGTGSSAGFFTIVAATLACNITVNVPALSGGQTYWVQFTSHFAGTLTATWKIPVAQSVQLVMYNLNPFTGLADPVSKGPQGGSIALLSTKTLTNLSISPGPWAPGTHTVQFFNGSNSFGPTTGTISYTNDAASPCPATPTNAHVLP